MVAIRRTAARVPDHSKGSSCDQPAHERPFGALRQPQDDRKGTQRGFLPKTKNGPRVNDDTSDNRRKREAMRSERHVDG
jgi:hypothetical protein